MGATSQYLPNGSTIIPAISLDDTNQKIQSLQGDGTYKWVHNSNTPVSATESLIWQTDGSIDVMNLNGVINVKNFGAKGDGVTDDTAAILAAIAALPTTAGCLYFPTPSSFYLISATLDFSAKAGTTVQGPAVRDSLPTIRGSVSSGALLKTGLTNFRLQNLGLRNTFSGGKCIESSINSTAALIDHCFVQTSGGGSYGIYAPGTPGSTFSLLVSNTKFTGPGVASDPAGTSIGFLNNSVTGTTLISCDFQSWGEGVRVSGGAFNIIGSRFEVNGIGMNLGVLENGNAGSLSSSLIAGQTFEANDTAIAVTSGSGLTLQDMALTGTVNSFFGGGPKYGLRIMSTGSGGVTVKNVAVSGKCQTACITVEGGTAVVDFEDVTASTSSSVVGARAWDIRGGYTSSRFINTNFNPRDGDDTTVRHDYRREVSCGALRQIDQTSNNPGESFNLRGKAVAVAGATTGMTITFPNAVSAGTIVISTATATTAVTASLALGTYFYQLTRVSSHGEISAASASATTIAVTGTQNVVNFTVASGPTTYDWKHRLYRGTAFTVYDGYYEWANQTRAFVDVGAAFDSIRSPVLSGVDEFNMAEPDANYAVFAQTNWGTLVVATSKLTTGFSLIFNTTSPATTGVVDWFLVR